MSFQSPRLVGRQVPSTLSPSSQRCPLSTRKQQPRSISICASSIDAAANEDLPDNKLSSIAKATVSLYKFTRPHTMLGTFVSVGSISLLAMGSSGVVSWNSLTAHALSQALSSALLMNICIVGINQIYDIAIDRINKPYLPLAAGDFDVATAVGIVLATGILSLIIGVYSRSLPLIGTLAGSLALGIAYSTDLPFLRWKKYPLAAAACILAVRAILVQLGFYYHMMYATGSSSAVLTPPILFATAFMLLFSIVIALFKDIPDVVGDSHAGLNTLSVRWGTHNVFWTCIGLLETAYSAAVVIFMMRGSTFVALAHGVLAVSLFFRARQADMESSSSIYACYMDVWKLFYAEYLLLPFLS